MHLFCLTTAEPRYALWEDMIKTVHIKCSELLYEMEDICKESYGVPKCKLHLFEGDPREELTRFCRRERKSSISFLKSKLIDKISSDKDEDSPPGKVGKKVRAELFGDRAEINYSQKGKDPAPYELPVDMLVVGSRGRNVLTR